MDLEQLERAVLEGARKEFAPSASDRMRIRSHLLGSPAWFQPAPVRRSLLRGLTHSWRGGLVLGFAVGALLGFGVSRGLSSALQRSGEQQSAQPQEVAVSVPAAPSRPPAVLEGEVPEGEQVAARVEQSAPAEANVLDKSSAPARARSEGAAARKAARGAASDAERADQEGGSTLAQELALLQRARRALNRNDAQLALGIVQSLDERFPGGVLMEERAATRILSLCQLGRVEEARAQGHQFLAAHARSVYAERVRNSCVGGQ